MDDTAPATAAARALTPARAVKAANGAAAGKGTKRPSDDLGGEGNDQGPAKKLKTVEQLTIELEHTNARLEHVTTRWQEAEEQSNRLRKALAQVDNRLIQSAGGAQGAKKKKGKKAEDGESSGADGAADDGSAAAGGGKKKRTKKEKPPEHKPKKWATSYMTFIRENRAKFIAENPGLKATDIGTLAGFRWKSLTAAEKEPYERKANEERKEYLKALAKWQVDYPEEYAADQAKTKKGKKSKDAAKETEEEFFARVDRERPERERKVRTDGGNPRQPPVECFSLWTGCREEGQGRRRG